MRRMMTAISLVLASAGMATAQDADGWTGFYAGFAADITAPEFDNSNLMTPLQENAAFGFYGGYNYALGDNFVVGAEVGVGGPVPFQTTLAGADFEYENSANARLRGGYAIGNALIYGTFGYQVVNYGAAAGISTAGMADGLVYGVGIEVLLIDNVSFRLDYTSAHMNVEEGTIIGAPGDVQLDENAIALGVALHF